MSCMWMSQNEATAAEKNREERRKDKEKRSAFAIPHYWLTKKQRKTRTSFSVLHKAEALTLLEELESKMHASLKIEKNKLTNNEVRLQVVVFHTKQEIGKHYGVTKQAITNLDSLSRAIRVMTTASLIKEKNLDPHKSRIQVPLNDHYEEGYCCFACVYPVFVRLVSLGS